MFIENGNVTWVNPTQIGFDMFRPFINSCNAALEKTENKYLPIWVNSQGGDYEILTGILDYLDEKKKEGIPIITCFSATYCKSAGVNIFAKGDCRYATPRSNWLLHTVSVSKPVKSDEYITKVDDNYEEEYWFEMVEVRSKYLFNLLEQDLVLPEGTIHPFINKYSEGRNELYFDIELAKEINLFTHLGIPNEQRILKDIETLHN